MLATCTSPKAGGTTPPLPKPSTSTASTRTQTDNHGTRRSPAQDLARRINPVVRGWINYYGAFYPSALYPLLARINAYLLRWLRKKHKRHPPAAVTSTRVL